MLINTFAKPPPKKQRRAKNNPTPTDQSICLICSKPYSHTHEVFGGINRQASIKYKMQAFLCQEHHTGADGVHNNKEFDLWLKKKFQQQFEAIYSRDKFMQIFGKNYLSEVEHDKIQEHQDDSRRNKIRQQSGGNKVSRTETT